MTEAMLWPFSWSYTWLFAVMLVAGAYAWARRSVEETTRRLTIVAAELREHGVTGEACEFTVDDHRHAFVVSAAGVHVVDVARGRLVLHTTHDNVDGLKVLDDDKEGIEFRLLVRGGAESRRVRSRSIAEFARLFAFFARQGKRLDFVPE